MLFGGVMLIMVAALLFALSNQGPRQMTEADKNMKNPVAPSEASLKAARLIFAERCVSCHGEQGKGDGPDSMMYDPAPSDLTDPRRMRRQTDGELFFKITYGRKPMPSFESRLSEEQRWELVLLLREFSGPYGASTIAPTAPASAPTSVPANH